LAGDNDCVRCAGALPGSEVAYRGSVARYAWDLAGFERSGWVVPLGASGDPSSPHHRDQLDAWVSGRLLPLPASSEMSQTVAGAGPTS
jgi:penicillin amidase